MARLPRLSLPGVVHFVVQRGHDGGAIVRDDADAERLLQLLREAAANAGVLLHAYALAPDQLTLLATPDSGSGVSRMMQSLGRHYAAWFNRRHGRSGALWDGRFRSALVESGAPTLLALRLVDSGADATLRSSAASRTGGRRDAAIVDPHVYWQLGNTPFERESRYRRLLDDAVTPEQARALHRALQTGRAYGSAEFLHTLAQQLDRPLTPRPRGRPRRPSP